MLACVSFITPASASVMGNLSESSCSGGGVTVTLTTIIFSPPGTLSGTGCIDTGITTNITYSGGTLGPGVVGNVENLNSANPLPIDKFFTFTGTTLDFVLVALGPGVANTNCATIGVGQSCSVFTGSPFILTNVGGGNTAVGLQANGTITDAAVTSNWFGSFTTQLTQSAGSIQTTELGGGSIASAQSSQFTVNVQGVPEPSAVFLSSIGILMLLVGVGFRKHYGSRV
jgi:hypothetical protein